MVRRAQIALLTQARRGAAAAQFELGRRYLEGEEGLARNQSVALGWLVRAAKQEFPGAAEYLVQATSAEEAIDSELRADLMEIHSRVAARGDPKAQWTFVRMVDIASELLGHAASRDQLATARAYLQILAESGKPEAQWRLSQQEFEAGHVESARNWARLAAQSGNTDAGIWLAMHLYASGDPAFSAEVSESLVRRLLAQSEPVLRKDLPLLLHYYEAVGWSNRLGQEALLFAARSGLASAQFELGRLYLDLDQLDARNKVREVDQRALERLAATQAGQDRPKPNLSSAVRWLTRAAVQDHRDASYLLGILYRVPAYAKRNLGDSNQYLQKAAELGQTDAQFWLGNQLWRERGRERGRDAKAVSWLNRAAAHGHPEAKQLLSQVTQSPEEIEVGQLDELPDSLVESISASHPLMALRIALGRSFRLRRIETLLLDFVAADHGDFLVVDLSGVTPKHTRRILRITDPAQRRLLDSAVRRFREAALTGRDYEGDYRHRLYLFNKLIGPYRLSPAG
jgi:TPR repeat protein